MLSVEFLKDSIQRSAIYDKIHWFFCFGFPLGGMGHPGGCGDDLHVCFVRRLDLPGWC
jgi:hypothetical protein